MSIKTRKSNLTKIPVFVDNHPQVDSTKDTSVLSDNDPINYMGRIITGSSPLKQLRTFYPKSNCKNLSYMHVLVYEPWDIGELPSLTFSSKNLHEEETCNRRVHTLFQNFNWFKFVYTICALLHTVLFSHISWLDIMLQMIVTRKVACIARDRQVAGDRISKPTKYSTVPEKEIDPGPSPFSPNKAGLVDSFLKVTRSHFVEVMYINYHNACYLPESIQALLSYASLFVALFIVMLNVLQKFYAQILYFLHPYFRKARFFCSAFSLFHDHFKINHNARSQVVSGFTSKLTREGKVHGPGKWNGKYHKSSLPWAMLWNYWTWIVNTKWLLAFFIIHHNMHFTWDTGEQSNAMTIAAFLQKIGELIVPPQEVSG
jgi:hypothetical protein